MINPHLLGPVEVPDTPSGVSAEAVTEDYWTIPKGD